MSRYTIVQPTESDAKALALMHEKSWNQAYPSIDNGVSKEWVQERAARLVTTDGVDIRRSIIQESYDNPDYYLRIAKDDNQQIIGFISARRDKQPEIDGLYIDSSAYGSGVALELAEPAVTWIGKSMDITVTVVAYNERAIKFYEKLGFIIVDGSKRKYKDTPMHVLDMIRKGDKK